MFITFYCILVGDTFKCEIAKPAIASDTDVTFCSTGPPTYSRVDHPHCWRSKVRYSNARSFPPFLPTSCAVLMHSSIGRLCSFFVISKIFSAVLRKFRPPLRSRVETPVGVWGRCPPEAKAVCRQLNFDCRIEQNLEISHTSPHSWPV